MNPNVAAARDALSHLEIDDNPVSLKAASREPQELPGPEPQFFFAPAQIEKRDAEWGPGVVMQRASEAVAGIAADVSTRVSIERLSDADATVQAWSDSGYCL